MRIGPPDGTDGNDPNHSVSSNPNQTSSTSNTSDPAQNTSALSNTSQTSSASNNSDPAQTTGVDPQAYPSAQQISQYIPIHYEEPHISSTGNTHQSSSISIPANTDVVNSRSTSEGRKIDAGVRKGVYQETGMHPGHHHALQLGVDPGDRRNISSQNASQNSNGTWYQDELNGKALIDANRDRDYVETVTTVTRPGDDRPFYRTKESSLKDPNGIAEDVPVSSKNVLYGNFSSEASRAAATRTLQPKEAGRLDKEVNDAIEAQKLSHQETEAGQAQWQALKEKQQNRTSMTPEEAAAHKAELKSRIVPGGSNPDDPNGTPGGGPKGTPGGGGTPGGSSRTLSSQEDNTNILRRTEPGTEPRDKQNALQNQEENPNEPSKLSSFYGSTQISGATWTANTPSGSLASKTFSGTAGPASGSVTASALGYDTYAQASAGMQGNKLFAQGQVGADAYLGKVSASGQVNLPGGATLSGNGTAMVGAVANGSGQVIVDPSHGTVDAGANVNAFVGAQAQGSVSVNDGPVGATAQGYVEAGVGINAEANVGIKDGKVNCDFGFGACLGVGGGGNVSFSIDVGQVAKDVTPVVSSTEQVVGTVASDTVHTVNNLASDGSHALHDVANFFGL